MKPCLPKASADAFMISSESATIPLRKYVNAMDTNIKLQLHQQLNNPNRYGY